MGDAQTYREVEIESFPEVGCVVLSFRRPDLRPREVIAVLEDEVWFAVHESDQPHIVVDFDKVVFAPSAVLGLVLDLIAHARRRGARARICHVGGRVRKALEIMAIRCHVEIFDTRTEAILTPWDDESEDA